MRNLIYEITNSCYIVNSDNGQDFLHDQFPGKSWGKSEMNKWLKLLLSLVFFGLTGLGISLTIKAAIGVSSLNLMIVSISAATGMTVGAITIVLNALFLVAYMALTRFRLVVRYIAQFAAVVCLGKVIDLFLYGVLSNMALDSYVGSILLFVAGTVLGGFSVGMVLSLGSIAFPVENACAEYADQRGIAFLKVRYGVDIFSIIVSLLLTVLLGLPLFVREGTIISLFLLTAVMSATKKAYESIAARRAKESEAAQRL